MTDWKSIAIIGGLVAGCFVWFKYDLADTNAELRQLRGEVHRMEVNHERRLTTVEQNERISK